MSRTLQPDTDMAISTFLAFPDAAREDAGGH